MHNCGENFFISLYEKSTHDNCPLCAKNHTEKKVNCQDGSCNDVEIKINQLSDELFSVNSSDYSSMQPAIIQRLWISLKPIEYDNITTFSVVNYYFHHSDSSPPIFIRNQNFRN
jgi:hypothetical protein